MTHRYDCWAHGPGGDLINRETIKAHNAQEARLSYAQRNQIDIRDVVVIRLRYVARERFR